MITSKLNFVTSMNVYTRTFWNRKKGKLKSKYPVISDKDLDCCEGEEREMLGIIANKIGKTEKEILNIILLL